MKAICTKDVIVRGRVVFCKNSLYEINQDKEDTSFYSIATEQGIGYFDKKDKTLKDNFKKEGDFGFNKLLKKYNKGKLK